MTGLPKGTPPTSYGAIQRGVFLFISPYSSSQIGAYGVKSSYQAKQEGIYGVRVAYYGSCDGYFRILGGYNARQEGQYRVFNTFSVSCLGSSRLANQSLVGYVAFIGKNTLPNINGPPTAFSATLPINYTITPPVSGSDTYNVLVRLQNQYGLQSQNQQITQIIVKPASQGLPPIPAPIDLQGIPEPNSTIEVLAVYPTALTDPYQADYWKVWIESTIPNVATDPYTAFVPVNGTNLVIDLSSFAAGTWWVQVALYRSQDGAYTPAIAPVSVVMPGDTGEPNPVLSGFEIPGPDRIM